MNTIVIDANILISALIKKSTTRKILLDSKFNFIFPELGIEEIYFYKKHIFKKSRLSEREFYKLLLRIFKYVKLVPLPIIYKFKEEADKIIGHIDKDDVIFIATALAFKCPVWSDDRHFKLQKTVKVYNKRN